LKTVQPYKFEIQLLKAVNTLSKDKLLQHRRLYRRNPVGGPNGRYGVAALRKTTATKNGFFP
jgi:hypothetical protein